jgi:hypothetical protein
MNQNADFSATSTLQMFLAGVFVVWALTSLVFWFQGAGKEPDSSSALQIILKYSPPWWRKITWFIMGLAFVLLLLSLVFKIRETSGLTIREAV